MIKRILFFLLLFEFANCYPDREALAQRDDSGSSRSAGGKARCASYDLTEFLRTNEDFGVNGVFDTMYQRIQIHFEKIVMDSGEKCTYYIQGADRLKGVVTQFSGELKIDKIIEEAGRLPTSNKEIGFRGSYSFSEDRNVEGSGVFKGKFSADLSLNNKNKLIDDLALTYGDGFSNFTFDGTWKSYKTGRTKKCTWGQGRLPNTGDVDQGDGSPVVNEKYLKNGWEWRKGSSKEDYVDNPKFWWRVVSKK